MVIDKCPCQNCITFPRCRGRFVESINQNDDIDRLFVFVHMYSKHILSCSIIQKYFNYCMETKEFGDTHHIMISILDVFYKVRIENNFCIRIR
jgi:hypothetical protein